MTTPTAQILFAVYDNAEQSIERVYESQRRAQTYCDEWNAFLGWDRYCVETSDTSEWAEDQIRWSE